MDNAAFQECEMLEVELAICLKQVTTKILLGIDSGVVIDSNGKVVGSWMISW